MEKMAATVLLLWVAFRYAMSTVSQVELCKYNGVNYKCANAPITRFTDVDWSDDVCHSRSCGNCLLRVWKTDILDGNELIQPSTFYLRQQAAETGHPTLIKCTNSGLPCECSTENTCAGTSRYCSSATCANVTTADCFCDLHKANSTVFHRINGNEIANPVLISYLTCAVTGKVPRDWTLHRHRRHLLMEESAVFTQGNLKVTYTEPIITASESGTLVVRIDGYERVYTLKQNPLQTVLSDEFFQEDATLNIIFVASSGKTVRGSLRLQARQMCRPLRCVFCQDILVQSKCLPTSVVYATYTTLILLTALAFLYVRTVLKVIWNIIKAILFFGKQSFSLTRKASRLALKTGAVAGNAVRDRAHALGQFLDQHAEPQLPRIQVPPLSFAVLMLVCMTTSTESGCTNHQLVSSRVKNCRDLGTEKVCELSTTAQVTLSNLQFQQCLWFTDPNTESNLFSLKIRFKSATCQWQTMRQYFTFFTNFFQISQVSCANHGACGWGHHCVKDKEFEALTRQSLQFPGVTSCIAGDSSTNGCFIITSQSCHFYRVWLEPDYVQAYEIRNIVGHSCTYHVEVQESINGTTHTLKVKDTAITPSGISVNIMGTYDQPSQILNTHLITRVGDFSESYLDQACMVSRPQAGLLGEIQANSSITRNFLFDEKMFSCSFYEDRLTCLRTPSYLETMVETKASALPRTIAWHQFSVDSSGQLRSELLQSAPLVLHLQFQNYRFHVETRTVCPKFAEEEITVKGCFACQKLAKIEFFAESTCVAGEIEIHFETITLHTRVAYLNTERTPVLVEFRTDKPCLAEKMCLHANTVQVCKVIDFCLEQAHISLSGPNLTYLTSNSVFTQPDWIPQGILSWTHSASGFLKLMASGLTFVLLVIFLYATCMSCFRK